MIGRVVAAAGGTAAALTPVLASDKGVMVATSTPVIWHFLGYPFEAASMVAALFACLTVRFYVSLDGGAHNRKLDLSVSALATLVTAGAVMRIRPEPFTALMLGIGLGVLGAGIIAYAKGFIDRLLPGSSTKENDHGG